MADLFAAAVAWMGNNLKNHAARSIVLTDRAASPSISITLAATSGRSEWEEGENDGTVHAFDSRDWLVDAAELVDGNDEPVEVKRGWIATDSLDGMRYEVYAPPGVRPWRYSDRTNQRVRIHSRALDR